MVTPLVTSAPVAVFCVFRKGESKASQPAEVSHTTCLYTLISGWPVQTTQVLHSLVASMSLPKRSKAQMWPLAWETSPLTAILKFVGTPSAPQGRLQQVCVAELPTVRLPRFSGEAKQLPNVPSSSVIVTFCRS